MDGLWTALYSPPWAKVPIRIEKISSFSLFRPGKASFTPKQCIHYWVSAPIMSSTRVMPRFQALATILILYAAFFSNIFSLTRHSQPLDITANRWSKLIDSTRCAFRVIWRTSIPFQGRGLSRVNHIQGQLKITSYGGAFIFYDVAVYHTSLSATKLWAEKGFKDSLKQDGEFWNSR